MKKTEKQSKITIDKLALMVKGGFDDLRQEMGIMEENLRGEIKMTEQNLRGEMKATEQNLRGEMKSTEQNLRGEMKSTEQNLREEFITSSDAIVGELQKMRQEHASSFGLYKELEQKIFTLEERMEDLEKLKRQMRQLQLKLSNG